MPRDTSGNYQLPAGNPVVSGDTIRASWANPTMADIKQELTNSLDRNGRGGMLVPFRFVDGSVGSPGITWSTEPSTGFFRAATNDMQAVIAGIPKTRWVSGGLQLREGGTWRPAASQNWVSENFGLGEYTRAGDNESITGIWEFEEQLRLGHDKPLRGLNAAANGYFDLLRVNTNDRLELGNSSIDVEVLGTEIRYNGANSNAANGVVLATASGGKIPADLLPFTGQNDVFFLGVRGGSQGAPPSALLGGYYIINAAGVMDLRNDAGSLVPTPVVAGDHIVSAGSGNGYWHVPATFGTAPDAVNVSYDNSSGYYTSANVQGILDQIGQGGFGGGAAFDPSVDQSITGNWSFSQPLIIDTNNEIVIGSGATLQMLDSGGVARNVYQRLTATSNTELGNALFGITLVGSATRPLYNGVDMALLSDLPSVTNYTQRAEDESISGDWDFQLNTLFGAGITTNVLNSDGSLSFNGAQLNAPSGLAQLDGSGLLPTDIVPFSGLSFLGTWNSASAQNPSEANPGTTYLDGQYFTVNTAGSINLINTSTGLYESTATVVGDQIIYVDNPNAVAVGWFLQAGAGAGGPVDASLVSYNPVGTPWSPDANVALVLNQIGSRATLVDAAASITESWSFNYGAGKSLEISTSAANAGLKLQGTAIDDVDNAEVFFDQGLSGVIATEASATNQPPGTGTHTSGLHISHRITGGTGITGWQLVSKNGAFTQGVGDNPPELHYRAINDGDSSDWVNVLTDNTTSKDLQVTWRFQNLQYLDGGASVAEGSALNLLGSNDDPPILTIGDISGISHQFLTRDVGANNAYLGSTTFNLLLRGASSVPFYNGVVVPTVQSTQTVTGAWTFSAATTTVNNELRFDESSFNNSQSFSNRNDSDLISVQHVSRELGSLQLYSRDNVLHKAGFRNPTALTKSSSHEVTQDDEGKVLVFNNDASILTVNSREAGTTVRAIFRGTGASYTVSASSVTLRYMNGGLEQVISGGGTFEVAGGSILEFYWASTTEIYVFGNGITV